MSSLVELLTQQVLSGGGKQIASQLGVDEGVAGKAVPAALGMLLGGLAKNSSQRSGAESLFNAVKRDHDGSILNDVAGVLGGGNTGPGAAILGHVFGGQQQKVESNLGQALGLDSGSAGKLLAMLAPIVLGALGKARRSNNLDVGDLAGMLNRERPRVAQEVPRGFGLGSLIDRDGDGEIADDLMKTVGSSLLKNLFR